MTRRNNPWPAFVDLFSALFIVALAGFMLVVGSIGKSEITVRKEKMREKADSIITQVDSLLKANSLCDNCVTQYGDDVAINLYFHFNSDSDLLTAEDQRVIQSICEPIKAALDALNEVERKDMQIIIEGHTDSQQVQNIDDVRARYLYNWNLSARRASSVLYEFRRQGISPPAYSIVAIGYADSEPLPNCTENTPKCHDLNRRTTIRLRPDYARIEARLPP